MEDEPQNQEQKAAVRALIDRMQPGEVLHLGERPVARYFYARLLAGKVPDDDKCLECISPNYDAVHEIQTMIEDMVAAGALIEVCGGRNWTKRLSSS